MEAWCPVKHDGRDNHDPLQWMHMMLEGSFSDIDHSPFLLEAIGSRGAVGYVCADASVMSPQTMSWMVQISDGFVCVAIDGAQLDRLSLPPMVEHSEACDQHDFAISVDANDIATTGISGHDRATTVRRLASRETSANELSRPGHVMPVRVSERGVSHPVTPADAASAVLRAARGSSTVAFAAVLDADGEVASHDNLVAIAKQWMMPLIRVELHSARDVYETFTTPSGQWRSYEYRTESDASCRIALTIAR